MTTISQLHEYERLKEEHDKKLALVEGELEQVLPAAKAQLAVALRISELRAEHQPVATRRKKVLLVVPLDITRREGFDHSNPAKVLSDEERRHLPEASLVVDALRDYVDLTLRLLNQRPPQKTRNGVNGGSI